MIGRVYIVGAGPGDPGLITVRGRQCLTNADVLIYDDLVHPELVRAAEKAEKIYVGKRTDQHSLTQPDINRLLVQQAQAHAFVVRLKGGDPFVFGRGGEEALALTEAGIPFEVVPGITAGVAAPAYAGIPVTHRGVTNSVSLITGHGLDPQSATPLDLSRIALEGTLCFYMSVRTLPHLVRQLLDLGRSGSTPAAVIQSGTHADQHAVVATLDTLVARAAEAKIAAPAMVVVGDVVSLNEKLLWREQRPLHRVRVAVTHMERPEGELEGRLREAGAEIFRFPTLEIAPAAPDPALDHVEDFDWLFLASNNAAELVVQHLFNSGRDTRVLAGVKIAAVGTKTAAALAQYCVRPDVAVASYKPADVASALRDAGFSAGDTTLFPRPDLARRDLSEALGSLGAVTTEVITYHKSLPQSASHRVRELLDFAPDWILFTNAVAVRNFLEITGPIALKDCRIASIGPSTSAALREAGLAPDMEPETHTVDGLVAGLGI